MIKKIIFVCILALPLCASENSQNTKLSTELILDKLIPIKPIQAIIAGYLETFNHPIYLPKVHQYSVNSIVFSPNGKYFASISSFDQGTVNITDARTLKTIHQFNHFLINAFTSRNSWSITWSPDSENFSLVSTKKWDHRIDSMMEIYNRETGKLIKSIVAPAMLTHSIYSHDGNYLARVYTGSIQLLDIATDKVHIIKNQENWATTFSPDSKYVATTNNTEGAVTIFDAATATQIQSLKFNRFILDAARSLAYSPDGQKLLALGNKNLKIWDVRSWAILHESNHETDQAAVYAPQVLYDPKGTFFILLKINNIEVWDPKAFQKLYTFDAKKCCTLALSPEGTKLIGGSTSGEIIIWKLQSSEFAQSQQAITVSKKSSGCVIS